MEEEVYAVLVDLQDNYLVYDSEEDILCETSFPQLMSKRVDMDFIRKRPGMFFGKTANQLDLSTINIIHVKLTKVQEETSNNKKQVLPISPKEAINQKLQDIPDTIIESVNEMIVAKINEYGVASFTQEALMRVVLRKFGDTYTRQQIFDNKWFDFEPIFRKVGWIVEYDKPGYNESYEANFTFKKK